MELQDVISSAKKAIHGNDRAAARQPISAGQAWNHASDLVRRHQGAVRAVLEGYASRSRLTGSCDRDKAERAVANAYRAINRAAPKFIWFESPLKAPVAAALISIDGTSRDFDKPAQWRHLCEDSGYDENTLLSSEFMKSAEGTRNTDLEEAVFREQDGIEIPFSDHDSVIARSLLSLWNEQCKADSPFAFVEHQLPQECARVTKGLAREYEYGKSNLFRIALGAILRSKRPFNRIISCRLGSGDAWEFLSSKRAICSDKAKAPRSTHFPTRCENAAGGGRSLPSA
jgi:hypothetical protein